MDLKADPVADPFYVDGPAVISFSGGRTSGLMLRRILDAGLQPDVHVLFANTGKEREETLAFVYEIETRWQVLVHWLERPPFASEHERGYTEVTYATASRHGQPFEQLITERECLPNPAQRWCTQELKTRVIGKWMVDHGYRHWDAVIGLRRDEPKRVADMRAQAEKRSERWEPVFPLYEAGITKADVMTFWAVQPFDLRLQPYEGNCDNCFLKKVNKRERIAKDRPDLNVWWMEQERRTGCFFRDNEPDYATLPTLGNFFDDDPDDDGSISCTCTD
jgi:3'-phosphoadenosine 5'-phosphosulfate sulfotransferase (PAPS reductase)/FAD synthetase